MNKQVCFVLAALVPLVLSCCFQEQWQGMQGVSIGSDMGGKPSLVEALFNVSVDAKAMKMVFAGTVLADGVSTTEMILQDYNMKNQYVVINGKCTMSKLTAPFPDRCTPASAKMVMSTFMGAGMEKLMVDIYEDTKDDMTTYIYVTKDSCVPVTAYQKSTNKVMNINYMGITPGIMNMTIFNVPKPCTHAPVVSPVSISLQCSQGFISGEGIIENIHVDQDATSTLLLSSTNILNSELKTSNAADKAGVYAPHIK